MTPHKIYHHHHHLKLIITKKKTSSPSKRPSFSRSRWNIKSPVQLWSWTTCRCRLCYVFFLKILKDQLSTKKWWLLYHHLSSHSPGVMCQDSSTSALEREPRRWMFSLRSLHREAIWSYPQVSKHILVNTSIDIYILYILYKNQWRKVSEVFFNEVALFDTCTSYQEDLLLH